MHDIRARLIEVDPQDGADGSEQAAEKGEFWPLAEHKEESQLAEDKPRQVRGAHGPLATPENFVPAIQVDLVERHLQRGTADCLRVFPCLGRVRSHGNDEREGFIDPIALGADGQSTDHEGGGEDSNDDRARNRGLG